ncbi:hypothetical protein RRF57_001000 [Xylaria bambusicola]|uniref:Uncharacterized protein n=1 Tax=Xylaria bambusicola TaxID=326684 RepID=A0AAN7UAU6_9PEZI
MHADSARTQIHQHLVATTGSFPCSGSLQYLSIRHASTVKRTKSGMSETPTPTSLNSSSWWAVRMALATTVCADAHTRLAYYGRVIIGGEQPVNVLQTIGQKADHELQDWIEHESDAVFSSTRLCLLAEQPSSFLKHVSPQQKRDQQGSHPAQRVVQRRQNYFLTMSLKMAYNGHEDDANPVPRSIDL